MKGKKRRKKKEEEREGKFEIREGKQTEAEDVKEMKKGRKRRRWSKRRCQT